MNSHRIHMLWKLIKVELSGVYMWQIVNAAVALAIVVLIPGLVLAKLKKVSVRRVIYTYFLLEYIYVILLITIIRRAPGSRTGKIETHFFWGSLQHGSYELRAAAYSVLNIALFVPYGLFISLRRGRQTRLIKAFIMTGLLSFLLSFFIECTQALTKRGMFEITDLFNNTLGGVMGAFLGVVVVYVYRGIVKHGSKEE